MRIITLNLNGIRSAYNKGMLEWFAQQNADILCVQELKAQAGDMTPDMLAPLGYHGYLHYAEKKGYSGVGIYSKRKPDNVIVGLDIPEFDAEGRYIEAQFGNLSVVSLYLPSGSSGEERQAVKFKFLEAFMPHLCPTATQWARRDRVRRLEHRPYRKRPEELARQQEELRLPAGRTRLAHRAVQ